MSVTILCDSMGKYVTGIHHTEIQPFPGADIQRLRHKIKKNKASISSKYTILHVGTNDIPTSKSVRKIYKQYKSLIRYIKSKSRTNIIISAIIPRPCDLPIDPEETRVKKVNKELKRFSLRQNVQFIHTYRPFLHKNKPIRSLFAYKDGGLHLNYEGTKKLRKFWINVVIHLK